jgi:hypothetical protein
MSDTLSTVLLLALPASGKSEVRRYLHHLSPAECRTDFHMGPTVQLDDFPYVHLMRRIDDELQAIGKERVFFVSPDRSFKDGRDWGTLIHLINEDYEELVERRTLSTETAADILLARFDTAARKVGIAPRLLDLDGQSRAQVIKGITKEADQLVEDKIASYTSLEGKTLVIEFARGGPHGSSMPLPAPYGYRYSIAQLAPEILEKASILYIWVTPEESRRKNAARTDPNDPGSILHHGVPHEVMMGEYGCDDMDWLEQNAVKNGTVRIEAWGRSYDLPIARFDNRVDKTSFIREDKSKWKPEEVRAVHEGLKSALDRLHAAQR